MTTNENLDRIRYALELTSRTTTAHQEALESLTALRADLKAAENTAGDNLCWIVDSATARALPEAEFLESCRRYRQQIADERGEVSGCRTIAQLEAQIVALTRIVDGGNTRVQGSPSTDTELEKIADEIGAAIEPSGFWDVDRGVILAALKSVRDANTGSPSVPSMPSSAAANRESDALRRKYAHFRALAICARELLTNEAHALADSVTVRVRPLRNRLMDAAKVIDADLRAEAALPNPESH